MIDAEAWLLAVVSELQPRISDDFAGLALVFYSDIGAIPKHPLLPAELEPDLPVRNLHDSIELLALTSRRGANGHDGFHFVQLQTGYITHVSQFLAPPIPETLLRVERVGGARHMAARLTSLVPGAVVVAICTIEFEVCTYRHGKMQTIDVPTRQLRRRV